MLTLEQHLLVKLSEECAEVTKAAMKALRFGLTDRGPGQALDNMEQIQNELIDLHVIVEMMVEKGLMIHRNNIDKDILAARREKVTKYMNYSRAKGTLEY